MTARKYRGRFDLRQPARNPGPGRAPRAAGALAEERARRFRSFKPRDPRAPVAIDNLRSGDPAIQPSALGTGPRNACKSARNRFLSSFPTLVRGMVSVI